MATGTKSERSAPELRVPASQAGEPGGQIALSQCWAELLGEHGITAAQMLVTLDDLEDRRRFLNASATLRRLIALDVVPVINENDSVATEEIRFGDNDRLAARIAQAAGAGGVVLLSDIDGLFTANPKNDPDARLVESVARIDARIRAMADGGSASGMGSGGMLSKLEAARIATSAGAHLAIANGTHEHPLQRLDETGRCTVFTAGKLGKGRKLWLAGRMTARGGSPSMRARFRRSPGDRACSPPVPRRSRASSRAAT